MADEQRTHSGVKDPSRTAGRRPDAELALPFRQEAVARILNTCPVGITVFDREGRLIFANSLVHSIAQQMGVQAVEGSAYNDPVWRMVTEDGDPLPDEALPFAQVLNSGAPVSGVRFAVDRPDGQRSYLSSSAAPLFDSSGEIDGVVVTTEEVTGRIHARQQLQESERRYRQLLEALQEGIWEIDQDAITTFVNLPMAEMLGYSVEEMCGRHLYSFMDDEGIAICERNLQRRQQGIREQHDFEFLGKDGTRVYASMETSPMYDQEGNYVGAVAGVQDITDRVRAEERLRQSEEKYRDLVERISDVIYALDADGVVTYVSPAVTSLLGYSPEEVVGQSFDRFMVSEDLDRAEQRLLEYATGRSLGSNEYRFLTASGDVRSVRVSSQPIIVEGRVTGTQGVLTDISERVWAEEQREQAAVAAERERLARDLHDAVTQSLFSVSAIAEALPSIWERDQEAARAGLRELRQLTLGVLAEMRTLLLELRPSALVEQKLDVLIRQLAEAMAGRTRIPITAQITGDCAVPIEVRIALYRIAQEALNNIVKHARASQAMIDLHCQPAYARLRISDDGRGFDSNGTQAGQLGLDIMRERAQGIGADLQIESEPGMGTAVLVEWQGVEEADEE